MKDCLYRNSFTGLGRSPLSDSEVDVIEEFTCSMFGHKGLNGIRKAFFVPNEDEICNEDGTLESENDEESESYCEDDISDTSDFEDNYD